ncbi:MAG: M48 family metalloprotease, partial [Planctomycetota bacterium]
MIRTTLAGTLLTGLLGGCATPTGPAPSHTPEPPVDAATAAGLDAESARRARWAGVLSDAPGEAVDITAVVATARVPVHALPSTSSRVLGTLKQSGEVPVEELLLWVDVSAEDSAATASGDGRTPTWARIRIGDVVGFVPWSCLIAPDRYDARPPADVQLGAENDLLEVSRGRVASTGGIPWDEVLAADPDREAIDALVFATEPRFLPSDEPMEALPTEFVAATPADRFFFGREQAGRLLAAMSAAPPDAEVSARVRAIGDTVADSSRLPRPYAEWIWVVLDAPEILDCFAMPGGFVFVTSGLLDAVANDDELAAILGREVARLEAGVAMPAIGRALV